MQALLALCLSIEKRKNFQLFLTAFFAYKVGCAKTHQHGDTAAERSILVLCYTMVRKLRIARRLTDTKLCGLRLRGTALEQTAVIGICKSRHAQSEDDRDCQ